jgi:hypothetical protein
MAYPEKPRRPAILNRFVKDLTSEEIASIPTAIAEYDEAMRVYRNGVRQHNEGELKKAAELRAQCETECGMSGHPKADLLWEFAWGAGHSSGLQEVYNEYQRFVELAR